MMKCSFSLVLFSIILFATNISAQKILNSGFDANEYKEVMSVNSQHFDTLLGKYTLPDPVSKKIYRSPEVGMGNRWDYWKTSNNVGIISIRGTAPTKVSWLENFYAAMVPATGQIRNTDSTVFNYKLAKDSNAYIHVGWLFGLSFMAADINTMMHSEYDKGVRNFIIVGHSQGGVLALMLRSYLEYTDDAFNNDVFIKTYASAPPKPGNLYYAYDFEEITQGGWAFRVINTADWVPQMPFTVQKIDDMNKLNPFATYKDLIKNEPWYARAYVNRTMKKINNRSAKLQSTYTDLLGEKSFKFVAKALPTAVNPEPVTSFDYRVCGNAIILRPTKNYTDNYVMKSKKHVFIHHHFYAYWLLVNAHFPDRG